MLTLLRHFLLITVLLGLPQGAAVAYWLEENHYERFTQEVQQSALRSRSEVIQQVKREYNAEVLKITLDERRQVYRVRVLMPNGKVRKLTINARR
jgi:uncharacterized membrane protein YkoI